MKKPRKKRVGTMFTDFYLNGMDTLVEKGLFIDRQDAIREAVRDLFRKHGLADELPT